MSAGNTWLEAISIVVLIALLCILMSPQLTGMIVERIPWIGPVFVFLHRFLDRRP